MASGVREGFSRYRASAPTGEAALNRASGYRTFGTRRRVVVSSTGNLSGPPVAGCVWQKQTDLFCIAGGDTILVGMGQKGPEPSQQTTSGGVQDMQIHET